MILTASYTTSNDTVKKQYINMDIISSYTDCEGKKLSEGYNTVMYTQNGHALYTVLTPEEITLAIQGGIMSEESIRSYLDEALKQGEQSTEETSDVEDTENQSE